MTTENTDQRVPNWTTDKAIYNLLDYLASMSSHGPWLRASAYHPCRDPRHTARSSQVGGTKARDAMRGRSFRIKPWTSHEAWPLGNDDDFCAWFALAWKYHHATV